MVVMITSGDWVTFVPTGCFQISTTIASNILGEVELTRVWWCPILWLPIAIIFGAECGCEYTSNVLFLNWMDGRIYWLCGPNWSPNSMPFNLF
jgi:hypothetical protein